MAELTDCRQRENTDYGIYGLLLLFFDKLTEYVEQMFFVSHFGLRN